MPSATRKASIATYVITTIISIAAVIEVFCPAGGLGELHVLNSLGVLGFTDGTPRGVHEREVVGMSGVGVAENLTTSGADYTPYFVRVIRQCPVLLLRVEPDAGQLRYPKS